MIVWETFWTDEPLNSWDCLYWGIDIDYRFNKSKAQIYKILIIGLNSEAFLGTLEEPQKITQ